MSSFQYTEHIGEKFHPDRSVRTFPGNTIICFVDPQQHAGIFQECVWAQEQLKAMQCQHKFGFLPPDSFHMTVFQLLVDQPRIAEHWSPFLPHTASLEEMDRFVIEKVANIPAPMGFRIRYKFIRKPATIEVEPADLETEHTLRRYRKRISEATGVQYPDHDSYKFHISFAYHLIKLTPEEEAERQAIFAKIDTRLQETFGVFETTSPQLVFFDDMFTFVPESERHTLTTRTNAK